MTTKIQGITGVEFPDATVQGSAAYSKAQSDANNPALYFRCRAIDGVQAGIAQPPSKVNMGIVLESNVGSALDNGRFTAPVKGVYQFTVQLLFTGTATATTYLSWIKKNGVTGIKLSQVAYGPGSFWIANGSINMVLDVGEYVECLAESTVVCGIQGNDGDTFFSGVLVSKLP